MLVLTRKINEKIMIGNDVVVTIVKVDCGKVRVGIEAPADIAVYREEVIKKAADAVASRDLHPPTEDVPRAAPARTSGGSSPRHTG